MPDVTALRAELDHVRSLVEDWKRRGSPEPEGAQLRAELTAAEQAVADAVDPAPSLSIGPVSVKSAAPHVAAHAARHAATSPTILMKEADARFWAQTDYKPGRKLDPSDPTDRAMSKTWLDVYAKVKAEDDAGKLALTYNHPAVAQGVADAKVANAVVAQHLDAAAKDPAAADQHAQAAAVAANVAAQATRSAAAVQPPTVSPAAAQAGAHEAHVAAQQPPPGVVVFPKGHPAHWHPSAQPAHPDLATPSAPDVTKPPVTADDHLALAQAAGAPKVAADAHERAHGRGSRTEPTIAPGKLAAARAEAQAMASAQRKPFALYTHYPDDARGHLAEFASRAELERAYAAELAGVASRGEYVATFVDGAPEADGISGETSPPAVTSEGSPQLPMTLPKTSSVGKAVGVGLSVAAGVGLLYFLSKHGATVSGRPH